jgi:hypothetical protein
MTPPPIIKCFTEGRLVLVNIQWKCIKVGLFKKMVKVVETCFLFEKFNGKKNFLILKWKVHIPVQNYLGRWKIQFGNFNISANYINANPM